MSKRATKAAPSPESNRTRRRKNRGFVSLEQSTRKHRRALRRLMYNCTISKVVYEPGDKKLPDLAGKIKVFMHTAGGSMKYH